MTTRYVLKKKSPAPRPDRFAWDDDEAEEIFGTGSQKFDPNQPRYPAGHPMGGQWAPAGGAPTGGSVTITDVTGKTLEVSEGDSIYAHLRRQPDGSYRLSAERQALHNKIVSDALSKVSPVENPEMHMMGGGPASGKSTMLESGMVDGLPTNAVEVNSDHFKEQLPEYESLRGSRPKMAAAFVHEESSMISARVKTAARAESKHVIFDTTGDSEYAKLAGTVKEFRESGYRVSAYYASLKTDLAVRLADMRGAKTGRYVPETLVRRTHANVSRTFTQALRNNLFDSVVLYDTNIQNVPRLVAKGNRTSHTITNKKLWVRFVRKGQTDDATVDFGEGIEEVARADADGHVTTHELERLVVEIVLGIPPEKSMLDMDEAMLLLRAEIEDDIAHMPDDAVVVTGKEYPDKDFDNLYDAPWGGERSKKMNPGALPHDGEGVENHQYVQIKRFDNEKQIVYGEVYAPNVLDTYGEFMTAEDIEVMAHRFMQLDLRMAIDTQHDNVPNGAYPVESFVAREGDTDYTPGAWVLGVKVPDPFLWQKVKTGELNGFSFQSLVKPTSVDVEYAVIRDHVGKTEPRDDHEHVYLVELDEIGNVIGGRTSKAADGHFHEITRASHTEETGGHTHRFFL